MLSDMVLNAILEDGNYFEDQFDYEKRKVILDEATISIFVDQYGIKNKKTAFIEFYSLVGSPPLGNGPELFTIEEIDDFPQKAEIGSLILFASGDTGSYVYDPENDHVYEFDFLISTDTSLSDLDTPYQKWSSFSNFLDNFYAEA